MNLNKQNIFQPNLLSEIEAESMANFAKQQIELKNQPRDDYLEFT